MFIIWLFFYYLPVFNLNIYYTSEQIFTDSNYYDFYALKFSDYDFNRIIVESNKTWQSIFVISFYSLVYKFLGTSVLSPILINLLLIYVSFYLIKTRYIKKKIYLYALYFLVPYMAVNLVVPGKDVLSVFFLSLIMSLFLNNYSEFNKKTLKILSYILSGLNRPNSIPILLIFEFKNFFKKKSKNNLIFVSLIIFGSYYLIGDRLSEYLEISSYIEKQRQLSGLGSLTKEILLPKNLFLYFLTIPFRLVAFLISPFPFFNTMIATVDLKNSFIFFNFLFKYFSGAVWFFIMNHIFFNLKKFDSSLILILISIPIFISTVHLVEGGRYRVICDFTLIWFFSNHSNSNLKLNFEQKK